jgi:hypothetical protein
MVKIAISELHATNSELLACSVDSVRDLSVNELSSTKGGDFGFGGFPGGSWFRRIPRWIWIWRFPWWIWRIWIFWKRKVQILEDISLSGSR